MYLIILYIYTGHTYMHTHMHTRLHTGIEIKYILCYSNTCLAVSTLLATMIRSPMTAGFFGAMRGNVGGTRQAVKQVPKP